MKYLTVLVATLLLIACDTSNPNSKTPEQIQAEVEASQKQFEENRRRIELENKASEVRLAEQRSYVSVRFNSVDEDWLEVTLTNETNKDIDNIVGSLEVHDEEGNYVTGIALTNWVPGDIYLPVGGSTPARKGLSSESQDKQQSIMANAATYDYHYTVLRIQFSGEAELNYQDPVPAPAIKIASEPPPMVDQSPDPEVIPEANLATPEACADNQITLETEPEFYAWPDCEHIGRNIDSERFKLEYINMCKETLGITTHLPSVAKVQVSSCILQTKPRGLTFRKRICCDKA